VTSEPPFFDAELL